MESSEEWRMLQAWLDPGDKILSVNLCLSVSRSFFFFLLVNSFLTLLSYGFLLWSLCGGDKGGHCSSRLFGSNLLFDIGRRETHFFSVFISVPQRIGLPILGLIQYAEE